MSDGADREQAVALGNRRSIQGTKAGGAVSRGAKRGVCDVRRALYERVKGAWEERFERQYGFWRGLADEALARYLDWGIWDNG